MAEQFARGCASRSGWLREKKYGFFLHHHSAPSVAEWNRLTERLDVEQIATQLHRMGAGYVFLTLGQNSGYFCSPNDTYQTLLGLPPEESKCSRRDLFADFADALGRYDIPLLGYTTSLGPVMDTHAIARLGNIAPWDANKNCGNYHQVKQYAVSDPRLKKFLRLWQDIHREWAVRWGEKLKGWWVDGTYYYDNLYNHPDEPNAESLAQALRAGNPAAIIALNPGVVYPPVRISHIEDYTAGEIDEPWQGYINGPMVDGAQYHVLTYAGEFWGAPPLRFTAAELAAITKNIVSRDGVITWDLPFVAETGTLAPEVCEAFLRMSEILNADHGKRRDFRVQIIEPVKIFANGETEPGCLQIVTNTPDAFTLRWNQHHEEFDGSTQYKSILTLPKDFRQSPISDWQRLTLEYGQYQHTFSVPVQKHIDRSSREPFLIDACDQAGLISFSLTAQSLRVQAEVNDANPLLSAVPYNGCCLEVFLAAREGDAPVQYILTADSVVYSLQDGEWAADRSCASSAVKKSSSYCINAEIPLRSLAGQPTVGIEAKLSVSRLDKIKRVTLSGNRDVFNTGGYFVLSNS